MDKDYLKYLITMLLLIVRTTLADVMTCSTILLNFFKKENSFSNSLSKSICYLTFKSSTNEILKKTSLFSVF